MVRALSFIQSVLHCWLGALDEKRRVIQFHLEIGQENGDDSDV